MMTDYRGTPRGWNLDSVILVFCYSCILLSGKVQCSQRASNSLLELGLRLRASAWASQSLLPAPPRLFWLPAALRASPDRRNIRPYVVHIPWPFWATVVRTVTARRPSVMT